MPSDDDPYKILGVGRDADLDQVRQAYRRAALDCHPDYHHGNRVEAERKLRELIAAYRAVRRSLRPRRSPAAREPRRAFTPQDYAREGFDGSLYQSAIASSQAAGQGPGGHRLSVRRTQPTRDETRTFIWLWLAAMVLACGVTYLLTPLLVGNPAGGETDKTGDILPALLIGEGIYIVSVGAIVALLALTRTAVRLAVQLAVQRWRILPAPRKDRDLPRGNSGLALPEDRPEP